MAKKKKQETVVKAKYDPRTKLGSYIQNSGDTMTSVPQKGYWENQRQQKALAMNSWLKEINKERQRTLDKINEAITQRNEPTTYWKTQSQNLKYSNEGDQSWMAFAEKQMHDTPGAVKREETRELLRQTKAERYNPDTYWKNQTQDMKYSADGDQSWMAYAAKQMHDTPGAFDREEQRIRDRAQREYEKWMQQQQESENKRISATSGNQGWEAYKEQNEDVKPWTFGKNVQEIQNRIRQGEWNSGTDPKMMNQQGTQTWINTNKDREAETRRRAEELKTRRNAANDDYAAGELFDWIEEKNLDALRNRYNQNDFVERDQFNTESYSRQQSYGSRKEEAIRNASEYVYSPRMEQTLQTFGSKEQMIPIVYNNIMPDRYEDRVEGMTEEDKAQLDEMIIRIMDKAEEGKPYNWENEYNELIKEADTYANNVREGEERLKWWNQYDQLTGTADALDYSTEFNPEYVSVGQREKAIAGTHRAYTVVNGDEKDKAYYYMNHIPQSEAEMAGVNDATMPKYWFATPEMVKTYTELYNYDKENSGSNKAGAFLEAIEPFLTSCKSTYQDYRIREVMDSSPLAAAELKTFSAAINFLGGITAPGIGTSPLELLFNKDIKDPSSWRNYLPKAGRTIREEYNADAEKAVQQWAESNADNNKFAEIYQKYFKGSAQFLLNIGDSIEDNLMAMGIADIGAAGAGGKTSKEGMRIIQTVMSGEATSNTLLQKLEQGYQPAEAFIYAYTDGVIEWFTERVSLEVLFNQNFKAMIGNFGKKMAYFGKAAFAEGSEEVNADLLNWGLDAILSAAFGHETELKKRYRELVSSGMGSTEASAQALKEKIEQIGLSGLAGAISGFGLGMGHYASSRTEIIDTGRRVNSYNKPGLQNATQDLINAAKMLGTDSQSYQQAEDLENKLKNGKKISDFEAGKLATNVMIEAQEAGEDNAEAKAAYSVAYTLTQTNNQNKETKGEQNTGSRYTIKEDDADYKSAEGESVTGPRGVVVYDNDKIQHARLEAFVIDKEDGKLRYRVTINGKQMMVEPNQIRTTNRGTAAIIESQVRNPMFYSPAYVNQMLQDMDLANMQEQPGNYMIAASLIRYAAFQQNQMPQTQIPVEVANRLYKLAQQEYNEARERRTRARNAHKAGEGTATIGNVQYGTKEFEDAINKLNLTREQKEEIRTVAVLAVAAGTDVRFVNNEYIEKLASEKKKNNPFAEFKGQAKLLYGETGQNEILINYEGQNRAMNLVTGELEDKGQHNIVVTFGHEFVHWLQQNSMGAYNNLAKYVFDTQRETLGTRGLNEAIAKYMNDFGYDLEEAIDEYVSDSCDSIFANKDVLNHIQKTNKTLFGQIRDYIKNLISRVRSAFERMWPSMSEASRSMINTNMQKLASMVNLTWDEAVGNQTQSSGEITAAEINRMSQAQIDREYMKAVENGDYALMRKLVYEAAKKAGYIDNVYHATRKFGFTEFDMRRGRGAIFVAYDKKLSQTYTRSNADIRKISEDAPKTNLNGLSDDDLFDMADKYLKAIKDKDGNKLKVRVTYDWKNQTFVLRTNDGKFTSDWQAKPITREELIQLLEPVETSLSKEGVYDLYAKPGNQLVIDAEYQNWDEIPFTMSDGSFATLTTREIAEYAKENGYDSVRINNVVDNGGKSGYGDDSLGDIGIFFNPNDVKSADPIVYDNDGNIIPLSERFNSEKTDIRWSRSSENWDWAHRKNGEYYVLDKKTGEDVKLEGVDREYVKAWYEDGDFARMEEILMDRIKEMGAVPAKVAQWDNTPNARWIARELKNGNKEAIRLAAAELAEKVPDNAVLVPMPPRSGVVTEDTDTMLLAKKISEITGRPVVVALEGVERESRQTDKDKRKDQQMTSKDLGLRKVKEIPEGTVPYIVDNLIGAGVTAKAAYDAMGDGVVLAYAKSMRSGDNYIKDAEPTFYDRLHKGNYLIPLQDRIDLDQKGGQGFRFSRAGVDPETGRTVYISNFAQNTEKSIKQNALIHLIQNVWSKQPISLTIQENGKEKTILAQYNPDYDETGTRKTDVGKMAFPEFGPASRRRVILNLSNDYQEILKESKYTESAPEEKGRSNINQWHYFVDDIYYADQNSDELIPYRITVDIKEQNDGTFVYQFRPTELKTEQRKKLSLMGLRPVNTGFESGESASASEVSLTQTESNDNTGLAREQQEAVESAEEQGIDLNVTDHTASMYSRASYERSEYYLHPDEMAHMLARNVLGSESRENVRKTRKWIKDVTSISAMIANRSDILDYIASPGRSSFKSNPEYGGSIDSSTICAKRRLQTGTIDAIQRAMPNYVMTAEDFLQVRRMMKERGYEVSCGLCFVESSRKNIAKYANQFMNEWNSQHPDNKVNMTQINTVLGLEDTRINNKEVYDAYEKFMNKLAQRKPKLFEMRSEYDNDILKHFRNDDSVKDKNTKGGMRINSFSDFEIVHLIDMMQVIMDMSNVGLAGQAYTKVREFAEALGPTGLKINMSMIAAGVDENGRIIFDEVEGMKWKDVEDLRNRYPDNVGTVLVVFTEDQLMAAMADDRIDFIIPFHGSQWSKTNYRDIGLPENVKDFTYWQNERYAKPVYGTKKDGTQKKMRATNYMPNEYWNPELSGKENAEAYLQMCYENNKIPKFWKWLKSNGDGSFSLKDDGSTDGYWKLLGDFKMYNHLTGKYAAQMPVRPEFDMAASQRMLEEYQGGHEVFPEATDVVTDFVNEKKNGKKGIARGANGTFHLEENEIGDSRFSRWTEQGMDVNYWMEHATPSMVQTEDERALIDAYRSKRISMSMSIKKQMDYKAKIRQLEAKAELTSEQKSELTALRNKLEIEQNKLARLEDEIFRITRTDGWAGAMYQHNMVFRDYIEGKTQDQVRKTVEEMLKKVESTQEQIRKDTESLKKLAQAQAVKTMQSYMGKSSLNKMAGMLRRYYNSSMNKGEISARLAEMALKQAAGQDITADTEALARDLLDKMRGVRSETLEGLKGTTLVIGQNIMQQLKADNTSLTEIRRRIKGSGIKIQAEEKSRLNEQWNELRENNKSLPDISDRADVDKLYDIVSFIESELAASTGREQFNADMEEAALFVRSAVGNVTTYLTDDPAARRQIESLMQQISELSRRTEKTAADMEALDKQLDEVILAGQRAKGMTTVLERDVNEAIKYYNTTARVAAENERNKVRKALIKQLRGETAQKLLQQQEKFKEQIANDKKARELAEDNKALRRMISTVASRMANRIFAETDQKNIPEETKALVRQVLDMLSQHDNFFRRVTFWDGQEIDNVRQRLQKMIATFGAFNPDTDLNWLIVNPGPDEDDTAYVKVMDDLIAIETGLLEYRHAEGQGRISLQDRKNALTKVQEALSEIWNVVKARSEAEIQGRKWAIYDLAELMREDFKNSRFKGERTGRGRKARNAAASGITWGNLTPEYFFKNLRNGAMNLLHNGLKEGENRKGLEANRAKQRLAEIAAKHGFSTWDGQETHKVKTRSGEVTMTTEQIMALYATWLREGNQMRPEDTAHLLHGGFVLAENEKNKGLPGREKKTVRPIRMSKEQLAVLGNYLTNEQKAYVWDMVAYMSGELAELGNEASMRMYGIKKFTEQFYFPIKSWSGVLNSRSDAGVKNNNENRQAQQGFSKRVKNNASNAIVISDFTPTAVKHVAGMIGYNTIGPAIENMNKVLNQQLTYGEIKENKNGEVEDDTYKQNMRAAFEEAYGKQAADYLATFMKDMNGGITAERTAFDKLLSMFKKNAVAGSLSVAAQQPLSYIRAAMEISPKYLAQAISPVYWKGSYAEMMKYSGLAVIKEMGKFDMNYGQTMQEWIMPEGMESKTRKAWNGVTNAMTVLPQKMDAMTWTRMWSAVKLEQMAQNPGLDYTSDEFLEKVAERFNEVMRRTQVYDSVMTKSQNMRSNHWYMKSITSFMAEPTLSLNVLADAWQNVGSAGGKRKAIKALVTFLLSAAAQAGAKAFFGTGRSPDKKKNRKENFLNKFVYNLLSEVNPLGLIPGYNDLIDVLTEGELKDDAMGVIGKAVEVYDNIWKMATKWDFSYRNLEDSIGQLVQLASDVPLKNLMRDFRALVNFFSNGAAEDFTGNTYADRPTSSAMLKYQLLDTLMTEDLIGMINKRLGEAGYKTDAKYYYPRIYEAEKAGNQQAADEMKEYLTLKSTAQDPEKAMNDALRKMYSQDNSLTTEQKLQKGKQYGLKDTTGFILDEYKAGKINRQDAEKLYRQEKPNAKDKDIMEAFDKADWVKAGNDGTNYSNYTPLYTAIGNNKSDEIKSAVQHMIKGGYKEKDIRDQLSKKYKQEYLNATGADKTKLMDALTKAYKATGLTADEALKIINGWKKTK